MTRAHGNEGMLDAQRSREARQFVGSRVDIEQFYDENPARRASEEFEYGRDWSDATGLRWGLSWVKGRVSCTR